MLIPPESAPSPALVNAYQPFTPLPQVSLFDTGVLAMVVEFVAVPHSPHPSPRVRSGF